MGGMTLVGVSLFPLSVEVVFTNLLLEVII